MKNREDKNRQWIFILLEVAVCFMLIYAAVFFDLPKNEYLFFLAMLPLYHAGVKLSYSGSIICGTIITLLFLPLIPCARFITENPDGLLYAVGMIAFINIFGVFVGGAIGKGRLALRDVNLLFHASDSVAAEIDERALMERVMKEALVLTQARYAAVLIRDNAGGKGARFQMYGVSHTSEEIQRIEHFSNQHPMMVVLQEKTHIATNSAFASPRFASCPPDACFRSMITVPVFTGDAVFGALMVAGLRSDDIFTNKPLAELQMLADTAAVSIESIEQETQRQKEAIREDRMRELFSRYVSSSVAEYVLKNPELLQSRRQRVSVIVSDIRDFTTLCETMTPQEIVAQLNEYFTCMVDVILENGGTIDKFIGDCIIAYWGAPAPDTEHAPHAAHAALQMRAALDSLNKEWRARGMKQFTTGIGLHTCDVLLGNLGDIRKKAFTIMGEEVDNAMKIEALTKDYGVGIIVTGETAGMLGSGFILQKLDGQHANSFSSLYELKGAAI